MSVGAPVRDRHDPLSGVQRREGTVNDPHTFGAQSDERAKDHLAISEENVDPKYIKIRPVR